MFDRLERANLKLKAKKCSFFGKEVTFLGHVVSENGKSGKKRKKLKSGRRRET